MTSIRGLERIEVDRRDVLEAIGYTGGKRPTVKIASLISDYVENAPDFIDPAYAFVIRNVKSVRGILSFVDGDITFKSGVIGRLLERSDMVAIFALTIGNHLEKLAEGLAQDGLVLKASVLEAVGAAAAEKLANTLSERVEKTAQNYGLATSRRFSPGYCDWSVKQQRMIFKALEADSGGVQLTRGCLMIPRKSVSGIIGIGPRGVVDVYNPCPSCNKNADCPWQR